MSDSDWWLLDLALVIAVTGIVTFGLFSGVTGSLRLVLGIPLVLFLPGYALIAVLYPDESVDEYQPFDDEKTGLRNPLLNDGGLETVERLALSVVASVAIVPAVALVSTVTPWGVTVRPILGGIALVTVTLSLLAIVPRYRCEPERRFSLSPSASALLFPGASGSGRFRSSSTNARPFNVVFALSLVLLIASAGFAVANPPQHDGFTEFYVETDEVDSETETMYDDSLVAGETTEITTHIENEEHEERTYTVVAVLQRVSYEEDAVTVHEQDELARESATVADGQHHEQPLEVTPTMAGDDLRILLLLYEDEPPSEPDEENAYRSVRLPVVVS